MASPVVIDKIAANLAVTSYVHAPGVTTPVDVAWVDMQMFEHFLAEYVRTVGTGDLDQFNIIANNDAAGGGTDVVIVSKTFAGQPDAPGNYVFLECTAQQIAAEGAKVGIEDLRYVTAQIELAVGTDDGVVNYIRQPGRFHHQGLSQDSV